MDTCATVKVIADNEQGFAIINEADFDAKIHILWEPDAVKGKRKTGDSK